MEALITAYQKALTFWYQRANARDREVAALREALNALYNGDTDHDNIIDRALAKP